ncbi:MAG: helix-turn-helix domain-containing protein [Candidatus Heimdallarchaeota archaeon]
MLEQSASQTRPASVRETLTWRNPTDHKVYRLLKEQGPMTRPDLVDRTGLPRSTLYDALTRLMIRGLIVRFSEERQTRGRPRVYYEVIS